MPNNTQNNTSTPNQSRGKQIAKWIWISYGAIVLAIFLTLLLVYVGFIGNMPPIEELRNPNDKYASVIYTSDGVEIGRYFRNSGNRVYADLDEVSPNVVNALIATEDARFFEHSGIDLRAMFRALIKTVILGNRNAGGGSTITQQLAKQLYSDESTSIFDRARKKPVEWMIAIKLERFYSKDEILKMYLNQFDFLYNAVGIKSAAKVYFNKDAKDLSIEEAATLVGMLKNPSYFNPVRHNQRTLNRRNVVLEQMYKADMLTKAELDSLQALPLVLDFHRVDHKDGLAPYFREELRRYLTAHKPDRSKYHEWEKQKFVDDSIAWANDPLYGWIDKNPKADGTKYDIYTDGLRIYTTLDSRMQQYAEQAVAEHMSTIQKQFSLELRNSSTAPYTSNPGELSANTRKTLINNAIRQSERHRVARVANRTPEEIEQEFNTPVEMTVFSYNGPIDTTMTPRDSILYTKGFLRCGFMSMDPTTGYVKAYVGGPDFRFFQYDMVSTGRRQIGSTIKPFLYTYAMESDFTPCDELLNAQPTFYDETGRPWSPRNTGRTHIGEMVTIRWALANSNNWITARLMGQLSPAELVKRMHSYGITNELPAVMSICLGSCEVSVKEMVTAYSAFANHGMRSDPIFVTAIADNNGNIISNFTPRQTEVITEKGYWRILSMLFGVIDGGTGSRLRRAPFNLTAQMGGKTGTTNSNSDYWFMGFTPDLVSGVWVGGEERYIHPRVGQGASMALPIFGKYISRVFADPTLPYDQNKRFEFPEGIDLCAGLAGPEEVETAEESAEGIFD